MRFAELVEGRLEIRWTWLPYWLAAGPALHNELDALLRDIVVLNGMPVTDESLDHIDQLIIRLIMRRFNIPGLDAYLGAFRYVREG
jgi:hypothetical protein